MAMGKMGLDALGLGSLGKPGKMGPGEDSPMGMEERAMEDMFTRGKAGDYKGAAEAFKRAYNACAMGGDDEEAEGETYPEEE
ncbi:MAG TPA: hypothetical protein VFZ21_30955 [Gemmatimonadaceae bacterium]|nr:hypothetical protein [Gemmatimonadaceae bacterium]